MLVLRLLGGTLKLRSASGAEEMGEEREGGRVFRDLNSSDWFEKGMCM